MYFVILQFCCNIGTTSLCAAVSRHYRVRINIRPEIYIKLFRYLLPVKIYNVHNICYRFSALTVNIETAV